MKIEIKNNYFVIYDNNMIRRQESKYTKKQNEKGNHFDDILK